MRLPWILAAAVLAAALLAAALGAALDASGRGAAWPWGAALRLCSICAAVIALQYVVARLEALSSVGAKVNFQRSVQHVASGVAVLLLFLRLPRRTSELALGSAVGAFLIFQGMRWHSPEVNQQFLQAFGPMLKASERSGLQPPGAFFFLLGCLLSVTCFPRRLATFAILCVTFGDPLAAVGGVAVGGPRLLGSKTLGGSLFCAAAGAAAGLAVIVWMADGASAGGLIGACAVCGAAASLGELFGGRWALMDDNLTASFGSGLFVLLAARGGGGAAAAGLILAPGNTTSGGGGGGLALLLAES